MHGSDTRESSPLVNFVLYEAPRIIAFSAFQSFATGYHRRGGICIIRSGAGRFRPTITGSFGGLAIERGQRFGAGSAHLRPSGRRPSDHGLPGRYGLDPGADPALISG